MSDKEVVVKLQLLQEVVDYLQKKPYHEVSDLINKIIIQTSKEKEK